MMKEDWKGDLLRDLRVGLRVLGKARGFTIIAVFILAVAIAANTALFSIINAVLLRPLPYPEPDRIVQLWNHRKVGAVGNIPPSLPDFTEFKAQCSSFQKLAHYQNMTFHFTATKQPAEALGARVSADFFDVLGMKPALGRTFLEGEGIPGRGQVTILSHDLWRTRFGEDPGVIGRNIGLEGRTCTVIGVMPAKFDFPAHAKLWIPYSIKSENVHIKREDHFDPAIGRLKAGIALEQAQSEVSSIAARMETQFKETNEGLGAKLVLLQHELVGDFKPALMLLLASVGAVLLIACANIANLQLARGLARQREIAIRSALGASQGRIVRQLLAESVLLGLMAGGLGLALSYFSLGALIAFAPANVPRIAETRLDGWVLLACIAISLLSGILSGLVPAIQMSRLQISERLKEGGNTTDGRQRHFARATLVVGQMAAAIILLIGAGLLIQSFDRLSRLPLGFDSRDLVVSRVSLPWDKYRAAGKDKPFFRALYDRISAIAGVEQTALSCAPPMAVHRPVLVWVKKVGDDVPPGKEWIAGFNYVTPTYLDVMRIPILRGRNLSTQDLTNSPRVVVIDDSFARRHFQGRDPLNEKLLIEGQGPQPFTVVGIAGGVRQRNITQPPFPQLYMHYQQINEGTMWMIVRGAGKWKDIDKLLMREVQAIDADQSISDARSLDHYIAESSRLSRFRTFLLTLLASVACTLAVMGIYSVIAYAVTQRTKELGLRLALGATRRDIVALIVGQGGKLAAQGLLAGLAGAFLLTRTIADMLFDIKPHDPLTFAIVPLVLLLAAFLASYLPARRATKLDPLNALRQ